VPPPSLFLISLLLLFLRSSKMESFLSSQSILLTPSTGTCLLCAPLFDYLGLLGVCSFNLWGLPVPPHISRWTVALKHFRLIFLSQFCGPVESKKSYSPFLIGVFPLGLTDFSLFFRRECHFPPWRSANLRRVPGILLPKYARKSGRSRACSPRYRFSFLSTRGRLRVARTIGQQPTLPFFPSFPFLVCLISLLLSRTHNRFCGKGEKLVIVITTMRSLFVPLDIPPPFYTEYFFG